MLAADEQVEVLRLANDAGVVEECMRAADEKRNARITQDVQRASIEGVRVAPRVVERRLIGHSDVVIASTGPGAAGGGRRATDDAGCGMRDAGWGMGGGGWGTGELAFGYDRCAG